MTKAFSLPSFIHTGFNSLCGIRDKEHMVKISCYFIPSQHWFNHLDYPEDAVIDYYNETWG